MTSILLRAIITFATIGAGVAALAEEVRTPFPPAVSVDDVERHRLTISPPERTGPGQYRIGEIQLNKSERSVSFPAAVNMNKGLLEYLLVGNGGKLHESLLRTNIEPYNLQLACLLVGIEGTEAPLAFQGDPATPKGDAVEILLRVKDNDGKQRAVAPETWLAQVVGETKRDVSGLRWVFSGSVVHNGRFAAQVGGSIIALYHDPAAMIDNASPGGESDKIWFVKEGATPPVGTPVTVTIKARK
jgi:hypothetical protein